MVLIYDDGVLHFLQGVSDAFDAVDAPLTLVLMIDVFTTAVYLGISAFNGPVLAALLIVAASIGLMVLWTISSVCYDFCKANKCKTKAKRVLVDIVIGVGGCLYLIGDNLPPVLRLQNDVCEELVTSITGVQLGDVTCGQLLTSLTLGQLPNDLIPGVNLFYRLSLLTYGKVILGLSIFLIYVFPACVSRFNTRDETEESNNEKENNFPVTFTLAALAMSVKINSWFSLTLANSTEICPREEMIAGFVIYGLFVIGWFIIIAVFLIADCRKAGSQKKCIKLYVIFSVIILIPSLPIYLLADNERPLSCLPFLRCTGDNDSRCDTFRYVRFGMLLVLGAFLTLLTAFTAACQLYLMSIRRKYKVTRSKTTT